MNIFALDTNPWKIPKHYCNLHVNKMLLESCQMLCNVFPNAPYKKTHTSHPCSIWVKTNISNYQWLLSLANAISAEYTERTGKIHGCDKVVDWLNNQDESLYLPEGVITEWPQCMPDEYKHNNSILAYRRYYSFKLKNFRKRKICSFKKSAK